MAFWSKKDKIAIVGAGPVGMVLANLLHEAGHRNITIFEKRKKYTRQQIVFFNEIVRSTCLPKVVVEKTIKKGGCYDTAISAVAQPLCFTKPETAFDGMSVQLATFEKIMYEYLQNKNGIKWVHDVYNDTGFKRIIGADGPNSMIRNEFFGKNVLVRYKTGKRDWYGFLTFFKLPMSIAKQWIADPTKLDLYQLPIFRNGQDRSRIFIQSDGKLVLNLLITKKELGDRDKIRKWALQMNGVSWDEIKKYKNDETLFPINFYYSKEFVKRKNGKYYYLVGDSAFNINFFSGMGVNNGIWSALYLFLLKSSSDYNELMTELYHEVRYITEVFIHTDVDRIMTDCKKYSKSELKKLISEGRDGIILIPKERMNGISKEELCMYAGRMMVQNYFNELILNNPYYKKTRKNKYRNLDQFLYDVMLKYVCDGSKVPNEIKVLFKRFDVYSVAVIKQIMGYSDKKEYTNYINKLKDGEVKEPESNGEWKYGAWWGYKYWTTGERSIPKWILKKKKYVGATEKYQLCKMISRYQKNKTMNNFIWIFMFASLIIPEFKVPALKKK
jgi:2-polyprenyl-6-methoxyphenol hydroxylase-like FAD-dependent oxidoreductase